MQNVYRRCGSILPPPLPRLRSNPIYVQVSNIKYFLQARREGGAEGKFASGPGLKGPTTYAKDFKMLLSPGPCAPLGRPADLGSQLLKSASLGGKGKFKQKTVPHNNIPQYSHWRSCKVTSNCQCHNIMQCCLRKDTTFDGAEHASWRVQHVSRFKGLVFKCNILNIAGTKINNYNK